MPNTKPHSDEEKLVNVLVDYYYRVDAKLDASDLDAFHDKSVARELAEKYAEMILAARDGRVEEVIKNLEATVKSPALTQNDKEWDRGYKTALRIVLAALKEG